MKEPRVFTPPNALRSIVSRPGGQSVGEAVASAERKLAEMRPELEARLDEVICRICTEARRGDSGQDAAWLRALSSGASDLAGLAGACGRPRLAIVARSLVELAESMIGAGKPDMEPVRLHVASIRLLQGDCGTEKDADFNALLDGLKALVVRGERNEGRF